MLRLAFLLGTLVALQGVFGLIEPNLFVEFVRFFQTTPTIYVAAIVRVAFGLVLIFASGKARARMAVRTLGIIIVIGGSLTSFLGAQFAQVILESWEEGGAVIVRAWAFASFAIGAFIMYASKPGLNAK